MIAHLTSFDEVLALLRDGPDPNTEQLSLPILFNDHGYPYRAHPPLILTRCADCGFGTIVGLEYHYKVQPKVLLIAWETTRPKPWHRAPGQQILCIGCLEHRLGRRLEPADFIDVPNPNPDRMSPRLLSRLTPALPAPRVRGGAR